MKIDVDRIAQMPVYPTLFALAFPGLTPEERFTRVNAGLAIAAYERTLLANESPFQKWLQGDASAMTEDEKDGAALFLAKPIAYPATQVQPSMSWNFMPWA